MRKLLPIILGLVGLVGGAGAGYVLRPASGPATAAHDGGEETAAESTAAEQAADPEHQEPAATAADAAPHGAAASEHAAGHDSETPAPTEFVKFNNQFVVPVIRGDEVAALVVMSITLEVETGASEAVFAAEPKLRDSFLQVLFDHANARGFDGAFTQSSRMAELRQALFEPAQTILGNRLEDVLIVDIVRQDS